MYGYAVRLLRQNEFDASCLGNAFLSELRGSKAHRALRITLRKLLFRETRQGCNCRLGKKTPHGWDKLQSTVDPRFVAGLPFPLPQILQLKYPTVRDNFPEIFQGFPKGTPDQTPETLLEFLICSDDVSERQKGVVLSRGLFQKCHPVVSVVSVPRDTGIDCT